MANVRYVITHMADPQSSLRGLRTVLFPAIGRYTYETKEEAEQLMDSLRRDLTTVLADRVDTLRVLDVECHEDNAPKKTTWPGDPPTCTKCQSGRAAKCVSGTGASCGWCCSHVGKGCSPVDDAPSFHRRSLNLDRSCESRISLLRFVVRDSGDDNDGDGLVLGALMKPNKGLFKKGHVYEIAYNYGAVMVFELGESWLTRDARQPAALGLTENQRLVEVRSQYFWATDVGRLLQDCGSYLFLTKREWTDLINDKPTVWSDV